MGKGIAAGATTAVGGMIKGASGQNTAMLQSRIDGAKRRIAIMDMVDRGEAPPPDAVADELGTYDAYKQLPPDQRKAFRASLQHLIDVAVKPGNVTQAPLFKVGQKVQDFSKDKFAAAKDYENSWTRSISEGLGSTLPFLAAGASGGALGVGAGFAGGAFSSAGEAIDNAVKNGATQEQIIEAIKLGAPVGLSEQLPIETLFERIPLPFAGKFANVVGKVLAQAAAEGGQEALQQAAQNLISKYVYKPDQDISEGVLESAGIGAIVGGGMRGGEIAADKAFGSGEDHAQPQPASPARATRGPNATNATAATAAGRLHR